MKARFFFGCGRQFYQMESFCSNCGSSRRSIMVSNPHNDKDAEELIKCFNNDTQYNMTVLLLKEYHNIPVSLITLERWLKKLGMIGLTSRGNPRSGIAVHCIIESEIKINNWIKNYQSIWHKPKKIAFQLIGTT